MITISQDARGFHFACTAASGYTSRDLATPADAIMAAVAHAVHIHGEELPAELIIVAPGTYLYTITCCEDVDVFKGQVSECPRCGSQFAPMGATAPRPIGEAS